MHNDGLTLHEHGFVAGGTAVRHDSHSGDFVGAIDFHAQALQRRGWCTCVTGASPEARAGNGAGFGR